MNEVLGQVGAGALRLATIEMLLHARITSLLPFVVFVEETVHGLRIILLAESGQ